MISRLEARWAGNDGSSEHLVLDESPDRFVADSVFVSAASERFAVRYRVELDPRWRVRGLTIEPIGTPPVRLTADGAGNWFDAAEQPLPELQGAIDIDLTITCFTNTLPVRRLLLAPGEHADITPVYFALPDPAPFLDPQRYNRLGPDRYRFDSLDSDFSRELTVNEHELVLEYPVLFRRLL